MSTVMTNSNVISVNIDVPKIKKDSLETYLEESQRMLQRYAFIGRRMVVMERNGTLTYGVIHDMLNPMTSQEDGYIQLSYITTNADWQLPSASMYLLHQFCLDPTEYDWTCDPEGVYLVRRKYPHDTVPAYAFTY